MTENQFKITHMRSGGNIHYSIWVRTLPTETWAKSAGGILAVEEWPDFTGAIGIDVDFVNLDESAADGRDQT